MKQTESAVRMLISAYKAVLTNCYIKENLLGGGKRLVKGAALSSFLTAVFAGISSPSFAVELESPIVVKDKVISTDQLNDYGLTQNNEIYGNLQISPEDQNEPAIEGEDSSIEIYVQGNSEKGYNGDFAIEAGKESHGIISKLEKDKEINLSADGNLTIDVKGDDTKDHGDGINVTSENKGSITLNANQNIEINAKSKRGDGLLVSKGSAGDIKLTATTGNNKIIAGNNGIDHHGSQSITLEAREANIITAGVHDENQGKEGDGIRIEGVGSVTAEANYNQILAQDVGLYIDELVTADNKETSGNITLTAHGVDAEGNGNVVLGESYGIHNSGKKDKNTEGATISVTAEIGNNVITGGASAVYNHGSGDILIQAGSINGKGVSPLYDYNDPNNVLIGRGDGDPEQVSGNGIASDSTGKTTVIAEGYNIIYGLENGIYSTNGTIDVTAGTNNIIGQYADKEGIIHTSKVGINVEAGTVNISSTSGENEIFASEKGISIAGENSSVSLNGSSNLIRVDGVGNIQSSTYGILTDAGKFTVNNEQDNKNAITNIIVNSSTGESYGINARNGGTADIYTKSIEFIVSSGFAGDETDPVPDPSKSGMAYGIYADANKTDQEATVNVLADDFIKLDIESNANGVIGIGANENNQVNLISKLSDISINAISYDQNNISGGNVFAIFAKKAKASLSAGSDINLHLKSETTSANGERYVIKADNSGSVDLKSGASVNIINEGTSGDFNGAGVFAGGNSQVSIEAKGQNLNGYGVYISVSNNGTYGVSSVGSIINISSENASIGVYAEGNGPYTYGISNSSGVTIDGGNYKGTVSLNSEKGNINIIAINESGYSYGVFNSMSSDVAQVDLSSKSNTIQASTSGIMNMGTGALVKLSALERGNTVVANKYWGIYGAGGTIELLAEDGNYGNNFVRGGERLEFNDVVYANNYAIDALSASSIILKAGNQNALLGAVYAKDNGTTVTLSGLNGAESKSNVIRSYAKISNAGDLSSEDSFKEKSVISALYAEQGANITLNGTFNDIGTYADNTDTSTLERTVWAYNGYDDNYTGERIGSEITIKGDVQIKTDRYVISPDSLDVAIAAGTGVNLDKTKVSKYITDKERAKVDINYSNISAGWLTDNNSNDITSYNIEGDILSAYEGLINIYTEDADAGINIHGNLLAGNNGILNVNLGKNGVLTGRADDYGDAGFTSDEGHSSDESFSDPAFSSAIYKGGEVNLEMGEGSRWNVTGQSWITRIEASDDAVSETSPLIDLVSANSDRNTNAHALTVYELKGNVAFNMNLDGNRDVSDMLYIKNAQGEYTVNVIDSVSVADMYANGHTGLRFATLGAGSNASFRAITWDDGVNNIEYEVATDDYDTSTENTAYNGVSLTDGKPGDDTVDTFFGSDGEPGSTTLQKMQMKTSRLRLWPLMSSWQKLWLKMQTLKLLQLPIR